MAENIESPWDYFKYYVLTASGKKAYCATFDMYYRAYKETRLFILLAGAFLVCRRAGYLPPPYLLDDLERRFDAMVGAETKAEALAALRFDSNAEGGGWQGVEAMAALRHQQREGLIENIHGLCPGIKKSDLFEAVSAHLPEWARTTPKSLKQLYYRARRKK